jgi:hypothetical protein
MTNRTFDGLVDGVEVKVYQAKSCADAPGAWHAHVALPSGWGNYIVGAMLPPTEIHAESIAWAVKRDVARGRRLVDVLRELPSAYPVRPVNGGQGWWCDVGFCVSEDEARERACAVVGYVFGQRLRERLRPVVVPQKVIPSPRSVTL